MDAIELLKKDHGEVTKLFQRFGASKGGRAADPVVRKICDELDVHARIEEEIFYPAVRRADAELAQQVDEALREHGRVKQQVAALRERTERGGRGANDVGAAVTALQEDVEHHVTEEEGEMFPRVSEAIGARERADLGRRLAERKGELAGTARGRTPRESGTARKASTRRAKATQRRSKT
ncbi:MAG TPA: hemerythrin domain-containing protein, partial [Candidatus Binatia bacterium]|nr:hemerythrin domain-containing protein [Candidatus Binatia bacterium]